MVENKGLIIRMATEDDAAAIAEIEKECIRVPWSYESIRKDLAENKMARYFFAEYDGKSAGYVGIWNVWGEGDINNVAVLPEFRRCHIGTELIKEMLDAGRREGIAAYTLEVRAGNEPALGLYRSFGFTEEGIRKGYYQDNGEDAVIMRLEIGQEA